MKLRRRSSAGIQGKIPVVTVIVHELNTAAEYCLEKAPVFCGRFNTLYSLLQTCPWFNGSK